MTCEGKLPAGCDHSRPRKGLAGGVLQARGGDLLRYHGGGGGGPSVVQGGSLPPSFAELWSRDAHLCREVFAETW